MIAANCRRGCWFSCRTVRECVCVCVCMFCACPLSVGIQIWPMQRSAKLFLLLLLSWIDGQSNFDLLPARCLDTCKRIQIWVCQWVCVSVCACEYEYSFELQQPLWESRYGIAKLSLPPLDIGSFSTGFAFPCPSPFPLTLCNCNTSQFYFCCCCCCYVFACFWFCLVLQFMRCTWHWMPNKLKLSRSICRSYAWSNRWGLLAFLFFGFRTKILSLEILQEGGFKGC